MNMYVGSFVYLVVISLSHTCMAINSALEFVVQVIFLIFVFLLL